MIASKTVTFDVGFRGHVLDIFFWTKVFGGDKPPSVSIRRSVSCTEHT